MAKAVESRQINKLPALLLGSIVTVITPFFIVQPAQADCTYQGDTYQTGQTVGPLICGADGNMNPR